MAFRKCLLLVTCTILATPPFDHSITFFVRQYPEPVAVDTSKLERTIQQGRLPYKILKKMCPASNRGVIAAYAGFVDASDNYGQIQFPRFTLNPSFVFIITPEIKPVFSFGNTIHHWELLPSQPAAYYSAERIQDPQTKLHYWRVEPTMKPSQGVIPLNAITIFAKPKDIYVPEGITLTNSNPQLVLPPIYAKTSIRTVANALYYLAIKQFFTPIQLKTKKDSPTYYATHINPQ